jgi:predicted metalloprotease with PDZ domain
MHFRTSRKLIIALLTIAAAVSAQEPAKKACTAAPRECEKHIREMLSGRRYLGLSVVDLKPGIVVKSTVADSPAQHAGFLEGDRIIGVNGHSMTAASVRDFKQVLGDASSSGGVLWMIIQRRGAYRKIEVRLEPYKEVQIEKVIAQHVAQYHTAAAGSQP